MGQRLFLSLLSRPVATKFEEKISALKTLCSRMEITADTLQRRPLFCNVTFCEQVKEDKPRSILVLSKGPAIDTN